MSSQFFREVHDLRQQNDNMAHELKRKEINLKELQTRLETGDGCKYSNLLFIIGVILPTIRTELFGFSFPSVFIIGVGSYI